MPLLWSVTYFDLLREMKNPFHHRLRLVESARQRGIKPTVRLFATTVRTVRKWLRRYQQQGLSGLVEQSRAPRHPPGKTPPAVEQPLLELRRALPTFDSRRLIREFELPISHGTLERIWRAHGLLQTCWITTSMTQGDTICLGFPNVAITGIA